MAPPSLQIKKSSSNKTKTILFILQLAFVAVIFILWFGSEPIRVSKNLWILFLCAFPSNFISGIIPYDPMIIYFAKYHPMFWVVLVGVASTLLVEGINYSVLRTITNLKVMVKIREKHFVKKLIDLFYVSPFVALIMAGFLPIPYYPFRILVILSGYPFFNYLLTVFISKIMRMSCLVWVGHQMNIPDQIIFLFFIGIIVITYTSVFIQSLLKRLCRLKKLEK